MVPIKFIVFHKQSHKSVSTNLIICSESVAGIAFSNEVRLPSGMSNFYCGRPPWYIHNGESAFHMMVDLSGAPAVNLHCS